MNEKVKAVMDRATMAARKERNGVLISEEEVAALHEHNKDACAWFDPETSIRMINHGIEGYAFGVTLIRVGSKASMLTVGHL